MRPSGLTEISENRPLSTVSMSSLRKLLPRSMSASKQQSKPSILSRSRAMDDENAPPIDPNIEVTDSPRKSPSPLKISPLKPLNSIKLNQSEHIKSVPTSPDPAVKVIVRVRPDNCQERREDLTSGKDGSLRLGDRTFFFDSILHSDSKQEDVFRLVGEPLVRDALAGYNTSVLCYGQPGSGKTYTMWGPPSAMVEGHSPSIQQGIGPRVFKMLFSEMQRAEENSEGKHMNYQCRCSFLEIYNGQLRDLLDPMRRNLEIKNDSRTCFYIDNLTEEYVTSYDDVTQNLIKGLSNRKLGAKNTNTKSSRSHIVFTCVIESWCKEMQSNNFGSSKTSRISLIDLAGQDRIKQEDYDRELQQQGKNVKKSLSQLGHIVSILAKGTQPEDAVYKNSCLTHLLQDSLGGNSKLSVICTISPDHKSCGETLSTLRFGQQVRSVKNKPVINEISEDDVNDLSDQIRQLKEELIRAKLDVGNPARTSNPALIKARSVRESVNQLRISLNRSLILPSIDNNVQAKSGEHDEVDVKELCKQLDELHKSIEGNLNDFTSCSDSMNFASARGSSDTYFTTEHTNCLHESDNEEVNSAETCNRSVSVNACLQSSALEDPALSESPKIKEFHRKDIMNSSILSTNNQNNHIMDSESSADASAKKSLFRRSENVPSNLRSSSIFSGPTESLEASLKRGLEIIDHHQKNSTPVRSSAVAFSFDRIMLKPSPAADKANGCVQTLSEYEVFPFPLCISCRRKVENNVDGVQESLKAWIMSENDAGNSDVLKDEEIVEGSSTREKELEKVCSEQATKIAELTKMMELFNQEKENGSVIKQSGEAAAPANKSIDKLRASLLSRSIQLRKSLCARDFNSEEELEKERERWTEMESEWINLTDELRVDLESHRQRSEMVEMELKQEKKCTEELDDALHRAVLGHARIVEHYVELQEKYDDLAEKHKNIMEYIAEVKRAAEKAKGKKGEARFAKAFAAELTASRVQKEKERERLKKENKSLRNQLRDTAEAVQTAGELLVRLREAEETASVAEAKFNEVQLENEKLKKQAEKMKKKHKTEMESMKQYMAESKLPQSALQHMHFSEPEITPFEEADNGNSYDDDQAWRAEFGAIYQDHHF